MTRLSKLLLFLILASLTIWYLSARINAYDLRFYYGKDNGYFVRLESICVLSAAFWALMTDHSRVKYFITGFFIGLFAAIFAYLLPFEENARTQVIFHILACLLSMAAYFGFQKLREVQKT